MVTLCILYNPVLAPTTPSVCGKCFSSTFTAALVSNQTLFLCPSFSFCLLSFLSPLWHLISFWVDLPPNTLWFFLVLLRIPFFFHYASIHPCLLLSLALPSSSPPGFICDHNFGVFCGSVCVCVCLLCAYTAAEERETTWQYPQCMYPAFPVLSLSFFLSFFSLETHFFLICHVLMLSYHGRDFFKVY